MMTKEQLEQKHPRYKEMIEDWNFWGLAYEGGRDFVEAVIDRKSIRETEDNFSERQEEAICFNYNASIIDLFNFYLTEKPAVRELSGLENDMQWMMFLQDCDFNGTNYDTFLNEAQKLSSAYGTIGMLVDKPQTMHETVAAEVENGVYPYCSVYLPTHIYDWEFYKEIESGRKKLNYLKLRDNDGRYRVWTTAEWAVYELVKDTGSNEDVVMIVEAGENPLGEIPFVWMPNMVSIIEPYLGVSDIKDISHIVASIIRNISSGEEIIKFAGFPMMRKPMRREGEDNESEDLVGVSAVVEFDPEHGETAKPDWMPTEILEPIDAILNWTDRKADEIYRVAHLSGVHGQRRSNNEVASGLALRYEFQQLTSVLSKKAESMDEAEKKILGYWLKWQNKENLLENCKVHRSKNFSIDDLSISLDNLTVAIRNVASSTFQKRAMEMMAKQSLPDMTEQDVEDVKTELEGSVTEDAPFDHPDMDNTVVWSGNRS